MHGATYSLSGQSPTAWLCYSGLERREFQLESGFYLYVSYARYPNNLSCVPNLGNYLVVGTPWTLVNEDLILL